MKVRKPYAENFYSGNIQQQVEEFTAGFEPPKELKKPVAGVVPHAGWMFSGRVAAKVLACFGKNDPPETLVLFGTVHNVIRVSQSAVYPEGAWYTPIGNIEVDGEMASHILDAASGLLVESASAHEGEHSIEVQLPLIKYLLPDTKIVPIAVIPDKHAAQIGSVIADVVHAHGSSAVVVGSTDLTHYGPAYGFAPAGFGEDARRWMNENDRSIIDKALALDAEHIVTEAHENHNACGSGALAAAVAFAKGRGMQSGILLEYRTSFDVLPDSVFTMAVGYAGIIF